LKLPNSENVVVAEEKIRDYILNPEHINGADKATFFQKFGFTRMHFTVLREALAMHCIENDVLQTIETSYEMKYVIEGAIKSPDNRNPRIRTIWFIENNENYPKFITAYPI
jgi:hypothetical protein